MFATTWTLSSAWQVLVIFLIPFGGGIPGGVLLAKSLEIPWPVTTVLYFISDVILACVFEPLMLLFLYWANKKQIKIIQNIRAAFNKSTERAIAHFGHKTGPIALILISLGVDPMTSRAAAKSVGHNFVSGWLFAIIGDLFFFAILMISTLWLNNILGDGTLTMFIILVLMFAIPPTIRKIKKRN